MDTPNTSSPGFIEFRQPDPHGGLMQHFQTITFMPPYQVFSIEELRIQDYKSGYGPAPKLRQADSVNFPLHGRLCSTILMWKAADLAGAPARSAKPPEKIGFSALVDRMQQNLNQDRILSLSVNLGLILSPKASNRVTEWDFPIETEGDLTIQLSEAVEPEFKTAATDAGKQQKPQDIVCETHYNFRVSSQTLTSVSPVFRAMLGTSTSGGFFKEGADFAATGAVNEQKANLGPGVVTDTCTPTLPYILKVESDDPIALSIVLRAIHGKNVPAKVTFSVLFQVAVIADKYNCLDSSSHLKLNATRWAEELWDFENRAEFALGSPRPPTSNGWLFISWVFRLANILEPLSRRLIMTTKLIPGMGVRADGKNMGLDLSPEDRLVPQKIVDYITEKRATTLSSIRANLLDLRDIYENCTGISGFMTASIDTKMHPTKCNAPKSLFGLRSHACDMLVYGSLCKALSNLGHNKFLQQEAQSHSPERFDNKSIYEVCNSLMDFEMYCPPGHQACEVQQQLIEKTSGLLEGLITLYDADLFERTIGV